MPASRSAVPQVGHEQWLNGRTDETGPVSGDRVQQAPVEGAAKSREARIAWACVEAARSVLGDGDKARYSRLLLAVLKMKRAASSDETVGVVVRRMLAAADRADGPVNGDECVFNSMQAEAELIASGRMGNSHIPEAVGR